MSQLANLSNTIRLRNPITGVATYEYTGESIGSGTTQLFVDGKANNIVALEPGTSGFIRYVAVLAQTTTGSGAFISSSFQEIVVRYQVTSTGGITISSGVPTYGTFASPETPTAVSGRLNTNVTPVAVSSSATVRYPHVRLNTSGGLQTNNWLVTAEVWTLPNKGS